MFNKMWKPVDPHLQVLDEEETELNESEQAEVLAMVSSFQTRFGLKFQPGYNHEACTLDFLHKPISPTSKCGNLSEFSSTLELAKSQTVLTGVVENETLHDSLKGTPRSPAPSSSAFYALRGLHVHSAPARPVPVQLRLWAETAPECGDRLHILVPNSVSSHRPRTRRR